MINVNQPLLNGKEKEYLIKCIDTEWISSEGPFVAEFENKMASQVNRKFGIAVSNGTAALEIAVKALGITKGDEVIIPTFTIISPASAITNVGAIPVLVDSDIDTWNMDVNQIESKITSKTKAILVVHIYGLPVQMDEILSIAKKYNLLVIEDAAEMHGQTYKGEQCGSFGDISIFSFYPNKHITTGEGGMIVTNDLTLTEKCKSLRNLCFKPGRRFIHDEIGWNYRMTNLQAALGLAQLERLDEFVKIKRDMGNYYTENLKSITHFQLPLLKTDYAENIFWVYGIVLNDDFEHDAEWAMNKLAEKGIGTRPFFWCMHEQPVYNRMNLFLDEKYPNAEKMARRGFYIPSGLALTKDQQNEVIKAINDIFK